MILAKQYRKKPVAIEAWEWDGDACSFKHVPDWLHVDQDDGGYHIETLEGNMYISPGDFIIRGIAGEVYPCKPDIFHRSYEEV